MYVEKRVPEPRYKHYFVQYVLCKAKRNVCNTYTRGTGGGVVLTPPGCVFFISPLQLIPGSGSILDKITYQYVSFIPHINNNKYIDRNERSECRAMYTPYSI